MRKLKFSLFFVFITTIAFGQQENIFHKKNKGKPAEIIEQLNKLSGSKYLFEIDDTEIKVNFKEENTTYRIDEIVLETLNPKSFSKSEYDSGLVVLKCRENMPRQLRKFEQGCVQRHILKNDIIRGYKRTTFKIDEANQDAFIKNIQELAQQAYDFYFE